MRKDDDTGQGWIKHKSQSRAGLKKGLEGQVQDLYRAEASMQ